MVQTNPTNHLPSLIEYSNLRIRVKGPVTDTSPLIPLRYCQLVPSLVPLSSPQKCVIPFISQRPRQTCPGLTPGCGVWLRLPLSTSRPSSRGLRPTSPLSPALSRPVISRILWALKPLIPSLFPLSTKLRIVSKESISKLRSNVHTVTSTHYSVEIDTNC